MTNFDLNTDFSSTLIVSFHFILQFFFNNIVSKKCDKIKSVSSVEHCNCCIHKLKFQFFLSTILLNYLIKSVFNQRFFLLFTEAHRALELLEDYHSRLAAPQDRALRIAIERVIRIFKSRLFQALLGESIFYLFIMSFSENKKQPQKLRLFVVETVSCFWLSFK